VILGIEKEQQGVAAKFDERTTSVGGHLQHPAKYAVEDRGEFFGSDPAPARQTLGEVGKAGDVYEKQRADYRMPSSPGRPGGRHARYVGTETIGIRR
jgi:hypothetical protein